MSEPQFYDPVETWRHASGAFRRHIETYGHVSVPALERERAIPVMAERGCKPVSYSLPIYNYKLGWLQEVVALGAPKTEFEAVYFKRNDGSILVCERVPGRERRVG